MILLCLLHGTWRICSILLLLTCETQKTESGTFFRLFIKRCNVFNHVLSNGKGFAFLQMINEEARRPVSYATQRFASLSYEQWIKIEKRCESRIRFCPQCFGASGYVKSRCRFDGSRTSPRHTDLEVEALVAKSP